MFWSSELPMGWIARVLFVIAILTIAIHAEEYKVETVRARPPEILSPALRDSLADVAVRIVGTEGPLMDIWLRREIPVESVSSPKLGIAYSQLKEGTLTGILLLHRRHDDYRNQQIAPGVYTLRYALHPVDGAHMGVAPNRDFLLLGAASEDSSLQRMGSRQLFSLSGKVSGTGHVSMWGLGEAEDDPDSLPGLSHWEDEGLWMLYLEATGRTLEGVSKKFLLVMVVAGQAPEA